MRDAPKGFRNRIAEHNRIAWACALFSLLGAALAWLLLYGLIAGGILLFQTVLHGDAVRSPAWLPQAVLGIAAFLLCWNALERWRRRYRPLRDRAIVGWHLLTEVLLLPPRLTLGAWDHLAGRIALSRSERRDAWSLLLAIADMGRANNSALSYDFPNPRRLAKLLMALQFAGWIDLHRGDEDWYYMVRSHEEAGLKMLKLADEETGSRLS